MNSQFTELLSMLLSSSIQSQIFHRQTKGIGSFAQHMALGTYYDDIIDHVDSLTESYQGKYGIVTGYTSYQYVDYQSVDQVIQYFTTLVNQFDTLRGSVGDSYIQNQLDSIEELIYSTLYKLKNLR